MKIVFFIWKAGVPLGKRESSLNIFNYTSNTQYRKHVVNMFQKMNRTHPRPKWKDEPSAQDRMEAWDKLKKLNDRQSFLRNPRFLPPNSQQGGMSLIRPRTKVDKKENVR